MSDNGVPMVELKEQLKEVEEDKPITASNWRNNRIKTEILPSGQTVKLKKVSLFELVVAGKVPDSLTSVALETINRVKDKKAFTSEELVEYEKMINVCVKAAVVEPPVADEPDDEHIGVREIDWVDRTFIFEWVNGVAKSLSPFRR